MDNILYQLYNGEIFPADQYKPRLAEHKAALRANIEQYLEFEAVLQALDPALRERFREIMDEHISSAPFEAGEMFVDGFRLGARIMLAVCREERHP